MTNKLGLLTAIALVIGTPLTAQATTTYSGVYITDSSAAASTPFGGNGTSAGSALAPLATFGDGGILASIEFSFQQLPASVFDVFFTAAANVNSFVGSATAISEVLSSVTLTDVTTNTLVADGTLKNGNAGINFSQLTSGDVYKYEIQLTPSSQNATFGGVSADFNTSVAVPEPEAWAMILLGLPMMGWVARRKQSFTFAN